MSPYLLWPDRAGSHLLNGQGLLQLGAECCSIVPALALPGLPATKKRELVFSAVPLGHVRGNTRGESGLHLQSNAGGRHLVHSLAAMAS